MQVQTTDPRTLAKYQIGWCLVLLSVLTVAGLLRTCEASHEAPSSRIPGRSAGLPAGRCDASLDAFADYFAETDDDGRDGAMLVRASCPDDARLVITLLRWCGREELDDRTAAAAIEALQSRGCATAPRPVYL